MLDIAGQSHVDKMIWILISALEFSGMHFSQAVAIIQSQVGVIKGVQVLYSETVSISQDNQKGQLLPKRTTQN